MRKRERDLLPFGQYVYRSIMDYSGTSHFMLGLRVCSTAVEPWNMDYPDISIAHTPLKNIHTFGGHTPS